MSDGIAVIGIDHRHCYSMVQHLVDAGAYLVGWATEGTPGTLEGWERRFPTAPRRTEAELLADPAVTVVVTAAVPSMRAAIALRALRAGKHVLADKPGALSLGDLKMIRQASDEYGRIWAVDFSERFEVPGVTRATALVAAGAIGRVVDVTLLAPHRLNAQSRPDWFWDRARNGGILADIGSHQIDQVLHFAGAREARVQLAEADCLTRPDFQDRGRIVMRAGDVTGTILVHWFTPDALPAWGDGRLFVTGTEGAIEVRKYVDPAGAPGCDHVILQNGETVERIAASDDPLPFFADFLAACRHGRLADPDHPYRVTELALRAQAMAEC
ncbi:MAG: Gfo/Idh/MocA family oxidoreductase [Pseudomonadota bacterium]